MEYLRTTTYNRITGMNMSGVCINYDNFWNDVRMTATARTSILQQNVIIIALSKL